MRIKPFKLERYYTENEFSAKYSLCNSDCEAMKIKDVLALEEGAVDKFHDLWLGYTETQGNPSLRRDIATIYDKTSAENILVCTGAQEPIFLFAQANLDAGDEVIVQTPCYQSLQSVPESLGCKILNWNVRYEADKPVFDIGELKKMITKNTKVIYLNTPHNPTGFHFSKEEQNEIINIARKHNVLIFSDEVYRELEHQPQYKISAFADAYENGVSIGVMSKSYGLPGLRIGWIATQNKEVLENVAMMKEYTTICNAAPSEFLAGVALRNRQTILARNLKIVEKNLPLYDDFWNKYAEFFSWHKPNAGPIAFVKMKFGKDDMTFAEQALKKKSVLLLPGGIYDYNGFFRIGFGRKKIPQALEQFEEFIVENVVKNHAHLV